jgi:hypothetical protein
MGYNRKQPTKRHFNVSLSHKEQHDLKIIKTGSILTETIFKGYLGDSPSAEIIARIILDR